MGSTGGSRLQQQQRKRSKQEQQHLLQRGMHFLQPYLPMARRASPLNPAAPYIRCVGSKRAVYSVICITTATTRSAAANHNRSPAIMRGKYSLGHMDGALN